MLCRGYLTWYLQVPAEPHLGTIPWSCRGTVWALGIRPRGSALKCPVSLLGSRAGEVSGLL